MDLECLQKWRKSLVHLRKVLALVWALPKWEYLIGLAPITLRARHSLIKYVFHRKIKDSIVSSQRIAQWTLALLNHNVMVETIQDTPTMPYRIIVEQEGVDSEETHHECPIPCVIQSVNQLFKSGLSYVPDEVDNLDYIWFTDGSAYYVNGRKHIRYAAIRVETRRELLMF